jgi:large subunit ribosomal protein L13
MNTYVAKPQDIQRKWFIIDAEGVVLGRMASHVAKILRGKHKPMFSTNLDVGDNVVIINADKVKLTGRKMENKRYYRHTGHPGGIKETSPVKILAGRFPERIVQMAVKRMMPKDSPLAREQLTKLKVYAGTEHPHTAQTPEVIDFAAMNPKNKR